MELQQIDHEIKKVIRGAYNVESENMKKGDTLTVTIMFPGEHKSFEELLQDLCYNEAFMHGLVMVKEPVIVDTEELGTDYTKIFLVMVRMQDVSFYIDQAKKEIHTELTNKLKNG